MKAREDAEEVTVGRGGVGDARVAEKEREDAAEGGDHDENGGDSAEQVGHSWAKAGGVSLFHEERDHGAAGGHGLLGDETLPGEYGEDGQVHGDVEDGHDRDRQQDGAGDSAAGVADLAAEQRDVVVAPVVIGGDEHGGGEAGEECWGRVKGSGRDVDGLADVAVEEAGDDDPGDGCDDNGEHGHREPADAGEIAVEEDDREQDDTDGHGGGWTDGDGGGPGAEMEFVQDGVAGERRKEIGGVLAEADCSAGDRERAGEEDLEEEEKAERLADASGVDDTEIGIGTAGLGERGSELGPDEAVAEGEQGPEDPAEHGLRAAHCSDQDG